jgi:DNA-binding NarL/FixJ family response regulator
MSKKDILDALSDRLGVRLVASGMPTHEATAIVAEAVYEIRNEFGGCRHYVYSKSSDGRNSVVISLWRSGKTKSEIAKSQSISVRTIDRIISTHNSKRAKARSIEFCSDYWAL